VEIGVDKNTTVVFPAPLMSTIGELGSFLAREAAASTPLPTVPAPGKATSATITEPSLRKVTKEEIPVVPVNGGPLIKNS